MEKENSENSRLEVRRMPASTLKMRSMRCWVKEQNLNGRAAGENGFLWQSYGRVWNFSEELKWKGKFVTVNQGLPETDDG